MAAQVADDDGENASRHRRRFVAVWRQPCLTDRRPGKRAPTGTGRFGRNRPRLLYRVRAIWPFLLPWRSSHPLYSQLSRRGIRAWRQRQRCEQASEQADRSARVARKTMLPRALQTDILEVVQTHEIVAVPENVHHFFFFGKIRVGAGDHKTICFCTLLSVFSIFTRLRKQRRLRQSYRVSFLKR